MTTSGTSSWQPTQTELVDAAVRKLAVVGDGVTITSTQRTNAVFALNALIKALMAKGMPLWAINEYTFALTATHNYSIGIGQTLNTPAPKKILQGTIKDTTAGTGIPLNIYTHYDYNLLTNTSTTGTPITLMYEPGILTGTIHLWPIPDTYSISNRQVAIVYQRPFEDMNINTGSLTLDFPQEWSEAIIYGLAYRLAPEYGIPPTDRGLLKQDALYFLEEALSFGTEEGSYSVQPDWINR